MAYSNQWYLPGQILYNRFWGEPTVDELRAALLEQRQMFAASGRPLIHVISDSSAVTRPVPTNESVQVVRELGPSPQSGWTLIVGEKNAVVRLTVSVTRHVLNLRVRYCDTIPQAIAFLKDMDESIDWSLADEGVFTAQPSG